MTALNAALAASDRDTAIRLAHTTKGASGNIGAVAVQELAGHLNQALKIGAPLEAAQLRLKALQLCLVPLLAVIAVQLPSLIPTANAAIGTGAVAVDEAEQVGVSQRL